MWTWLNEIEIPAILWVQRSITPFWEWFWQIVTRTAEFWGFIPIALLILVLFRKQEGIKQSAKLLVVVVGAGFLSWIIKIITRRDRPHLVSGDINLLYQPDSSAFPSGHTAMGCAIAIFLCIIIWRHLRVSKPVRVAACVPIVAVFALGVGFSRIFLGVHYPSDIIASYVLAVPFYILCAFVFERVWRFAAARRRLPQSKTVASLSATNRLAMRFANHLRRQNHVGVVLLNGDLGVGKTTFVKMVLRHLHYKAPATSPTYSIINQYDDAYHIDLYRLDDPAELQNTEFYDIINGEHLVFIEWAEKLPPDTISDASVVSIELSDDKRAFTFGGANENPVH